MCVVQMVNLMMLAEAFDMVFRNGKKIQQSCGWFVKFSGKLNVQKVGQVQAHYNSMKFCFMKKRGHG